MIVTALTESTTVFRLAQWRTNVLLMEHDDAVLIVDPAWTPAEIAEIEKRASSHGVPIHFLLTHADPDHVCGIAQFPDATIYLEPRSAAMIDQGVSEQVLRATAADWGLEFGYDLRYDRVIDPGARFEAGPWTIDTVEARGHIGDGIAYVIEEQGLLVAGDYLSTSMAPLVWGSPTAFRETTQRLIDALDAIASCIVVPGHGDLLTGADAQRVGKQDIAYLSALEAAAAKAKAGSLSWSDALTSLLAVPLPRPFEPDIEIYAPSVMNAKRALFDVGILPPGTSKPPLYGV